MKQKLTEAEIRRGLEQGRYRRDGTVVRNPENGQIVKFFHEPEAIPSSLPVSLVQINQNIIYQADLPEFLRAIDELRAAQIYDDLEGHYTLTLDYLTEYRTYGKNSDLASLRTACLRAAADFDRRITKLSADLQPLEENDIEIFFAALNAYVRLLFIFIISSALENKSNFSRDRLILQKITNFRAALTPLYERVAAKTWNGRFSIEDSIYAALLYSKNYDQRELESFIAHDTRFASSSDIVSHFKRNVITESSYNSPIVTVSISFRADASWMSSRRYDIATQLRNVLEDINRLERMRMEIIEGVEKAGEDVSTYLDSLLLATEAPVIPLE
ncbi:hypothetical protein D9M68_58490 [compost metagenome]